VPVVPGNDSYKVVRKRGLGSIPSRSIGPDLITKGKFMTHRQPWLTLYTILVGLFCLSFAFNIHLLNKIYILENCLHFSRCNTTESEFRKMQDEIQRLGNNTDTYIHIGEPKSVLVK
jgi:hypothetical protein